jgi:hypothetical protein
MFCLAVPFFGGFLGALGVVGVHCLLCIIGFIPQLNHLSLQLVKDISWGGAMWGFIPALFLLLRKGNLYLVSLLTWFIATSYDLFILRGLPLLLSSETAATYLMSIVYVPILGFILTHTHRLVEYKVIFENLLPKPTRILKPPKKFFQCPYCRSKFEQFSEFSSHIHKHSTS